MLAIADHMAVNLQQLGVWQLVLVRPEPAKQAPKRRCYAKSPGQWPCWLIRFHVGARFFALGWVNHRGNTRFPAWNMSAVHSATGFRVLPVSCAMNSARGLSSCTPWFTSSLNMPRCRATFSSALSRLRVCTSKPFLVIFTPS